MNVLSVTKKRGKDYQSGYAAGVKAGIKAAVKVLMYAVCQYLGDKRGWKRESIARAILWLHKHCMMQLKGYTTAKEVEDSVIEEYGIKFEDGTMVFLTGEDWEKEKKRLA